MGGRGLDNGIIGYIESCSMEYSNVVYRTLITYVACAICTTTHYSECHPGVCRII